MNKPTQVPDATSPRAKKPRGMDPELLRMNRILRLVDETDLAELLYLQGRLASAIERTANPGEA